MRFDDSIRACCRTLTKARASPLDMLLVHSVQIQRLSEEIASTFHYYSLTSGQHPSLDSVDISVKAFERRIQDLEDFAKAGNEFSSKS